jgi:hypothetical protein
MSTPAKVKQNIDSKHERRPHFPLSCTYACPCRRCEGAVLCTPALALGLHLHQGRVLDVDDDTTN